MKELYSFTLTKTTTVSETTDTPEGKLTKDVQKEIPVRVILKSPSRKENEEAETLYSVELHRCMRAGMLTEPLLVKYYANEGGIFSEEEQKEYSSLLLRFMEKQNEYQRANLLPEGAEKAERFEKAKTDLIDIQTRLQDFKRAQQSLFNQTAEKKAGDKTITWYAMRLPYLQEGEGEPVAMFAGESFEDRLNEFDSKEDDEFFGRVFQRVLLFITFWYMGNVQKKEDFKFLEDTLKEQDKKPTPEVTPEVTP